MKVQLKVGHRPKFAGPLADVYGLGGILYALLTGRPPFQGPRSLQLVAEIMLDQPPAPSTLREGVPPALEAICLKCLQKHPDDRYSGAAAVADELRRFLKGEEAPPSPPPPMDASSSFRGSPATPSSRSRGHRGRSQNS